MAKTADEMVMEIRKFFQDSQIDNSELLKLWNVLTGLRGPDAGGANHVRAEAKDATTAVIRHFVLQINLDADRELPVDVAERDTDERAAVRRNLQEDDIIGPHFYDHAKRAFKALGLSWNHTNVERPGPMVGVYVDEAKNISFDLGTRDPNPGGD